MATVSVRYIVNDVAAAIAFYTRHLGFTEVMHPAPAFAMLSRGDLRLVLSAPGAGPPGRPGDARWDAADARRLEPVLGRGRRPRRPRGEAARGGVRFRNEVVTGTGGKQILAEDPSGNPVELFEPTLPEAKLQ